MKRSSAFVLLIAATACGNSATGSDANPAGENPPQTLVQRAPTTTPVAAPASPPTAVTPIASPITKIPITETPTAVTPTAVTPSAVTPSGNTQGDTVRNASSAKRQAWLARAPSRYVVTECGYGAAPPACSVQAVDSGQVVASTSRFLLTEPWVEGTPDITTEEPIAALFTELEAPIDGCKTSYELDAAYGYPSQVYFDCGEEGWGTRVTCFEPDTLDLERCQ